jgi:glycosyltransferase involved in cell wall biosynthesis
MLSAVLREQPDVVVLESRLGFLTTLLTSMLPRRDRRTAWWLSGYEGASERMNRMKRVVRRAVFRRGDGYICYGNAARRHLERLGRADRPIFIAFNSLDSEAIRSQRDALLSDPAWQTEGRARIRDGAGFQILYTGRVEPSKRLPDLLQAVKIFNEQAPDLRIKLLCVGGGEGLQRIIDLADELGIAHLVMFTGPVYDEVRLAQYFLSSDAFVLPGTGGLAINQAISYGLPVVTSVADGTEQDTVHDGVNGIYFELGNPASLAERLLYLARRPDLCAHLALGSLRVAEETSNMDRMVEGFVGAIGTLTGDRR